MKLIYYICLLFFIISCEEDLYMANPLDPNNLNFIPPETIITNYESLNESIIDTSSLTIFWKGNELATKYSHNLDSTQWSDWSADTTVTLNNLNNGLHIFYVKSRYGAGIEDETPASVSFTVNMIIDCAGTSNGDNVEDMCGTCDNDSTNDCVQDDCGVWGGNNSPYTGICDCLGVPHGEASLDCTGECNGEAVEDNCGTCDTNPYNDCFQDCEGNWLTRSQSCEYRLGWGDSCDILNPINACNIEGGCDDYCGGSDCVAGGLCLPNSIFPPTFNCQCVCGESLPDYLPESIGDCNFMEIINENTISDECRNIVEDYLPSENILPDLTSPIGKGLINGNPVLFIMGSDILGTSLDLNTSEITIASTANSIIDTLTESDYNLKTIQDYVDDIGNIISVSSIIDYSGSMRSNDIDDAVEIYSDIFTVFNPLFESEIRLFSNCVIRKVDFTSNQSILLDKIERDERIDRGSTSLFDAIGEGLSALSTRDGLIKLLIVSTDGLENSSITYTDENGIIDFAKQSEIPIIFFGTLFADLTFMRDISEETNGLFIFNSTFKSIKNDALVLYDMLSNIQAIEITGEDWTNATSFQVTIDGKALVFNLD